MGAFSRKKNQFLISTDPSLLDLNRIYQNIVESYWAKGIPRSVFEKSLRNSLCFGLYCRTEQVGFARVVTDCSTFAYLGDVFIEESYRQRGLAQWLMESVMDHPDLKGLRRICLGTRDAHGLYRKFGFEVIQEPQNWMEIKTPGVYLKKNDGGRQDIEV